VSGQHARILQDPQETFRFSIVDLNSRNGNVREPAAGGRHGDHQSGDLIQFRPRT
jgi:pSer/pThr/pTyr-binding forkhead associated (FHA) protein